MKITFGRAAAPIALLLAVPALAAQPEDQAKGVEAAEATEAGKKEESVPTAEPKAKEEKRICRRVRTDASSRRATKVCKTKNEWREFNQRR
ncbi:hypothetical protein [Erythrobacter crassostreae]|uniref:PsiF repeat-containing protein n=1 Tax=Erythrobacter crassostreae TaxID=2828328 RepID=A0A9X1F4M9_9SPHN|nr:hypothetical protein [Erythrobacter crassostrea]MBV7259896.1 hypothetical protein [Erythrobacter crassostrea]